MRITLTPVFPYLVEQMEAEMDPRWKENRFFWSVQTDLFPIDTFTFSDICSSSQAMKVIQLWRKNLFFFGSISSRLNPRFFKEGGTLKPLEVNRNINLRTTNWEENWPGSKTFVFVMSSPQLFTYTVTSSRYNRCKPDLITCSIVSKLHLLTLVESF